ncbi:MAG: HAMP domain-containing histidine kinase [Proteobacteria bacterium]|nr:HAMP domain-containing histidine kinase [Pseudomonadota bacterium]
MVQVGGKQYRITLGYLLFYIWLATVIAIIAWFAIRSYQITYTATYRLLDSEITMQGEKVVDSLQSIERILQTAVWQANASQDFELNALISTLKANRIQDAMPVNGVAWGGTDKRIISIFGFDACSSYDIGELLQNSATVRGKLQFGDMLRCGDARGVLAAFAISNKSGTYLGSIVLLLDLDALYSKSGVEGAELHYTILQKEALKTTKFLHAFGLDDYTARKITAHVNHISAKDFAWIEPLSDLLYQRTPVMIKTLEGYPLYIIAIAQHFITADLLTAIAVILWDVMFMFAIMFWVMLVTHKLVLIPISSFVGAVSAAEQGVIYHPSGYSILEYQSLSLLIVQNIAQNENVRAEKEKRDFLTTQLKAETDAQAGLLRNIQHEMRTPLHHIMTAAEMLQKRKNLTDDLKEYLEMIHQAGAQILKVSNDMIAAATIESGLMSLNEKYCNVSDLLQQAIARGNAAAIQRSIVISTNLPVDLPQVNVDSSRFTEALFYLLENSIKFGKPGGVVHLAAKRTNSGLVIDIIDDGAGISEDQMHRINTTLTTTYSVLRKAQEGVGFGLAIAYTILEMHNAKLEIERHANGGVIAKITVPNIRIKS